MVKFIRLVAVAATLTALAACGEKKDAVDVQKVIQEGMQKEKAMMEGMQKNVESMEKKMTEQKEETKK
ncbi:MAG: hypothetical protein FJ143_18550 [Deltaproteobacteria bacterium]|nr:hypothetical protein [Deltaproteobacteria bacterium]MBM4299747.1 hypothetical protein [Deltaproteobacteria bacterium]